ncbi:DUF1549 and DUF1553 domain-containing protein [Humisphaera borealis]|nr:DUF1549 and DUF1553 domain-containing protein [Humisphaera borealis]
MPSRKSMTWLLGSAVCVSLLGGAALNSSAADDAKSPVPAAHPATPAPAVAGPFQVFPPDVSLESSRDYQSIVVQVTRPDGVTLDVTAESKITLADPSMAKVEGATIRPVADGTSQVIVTYQDHKAILPLTVKQAKDDRPVSFRLDVMPVFLKAGCNTGGCHGSARGKDGFMLSLFGYDAAGDYDRITRAQTTRRINLAVPEESLMITKSLGSVQHTGGQLFKKGDHLHTAMLRWLEAGAPDDAPQVAEPISLELYPKLTVIESDSTQQFVARAKYSDGTDRDVTNLVLLSSNNDNSAPIDANGKLTAKSRGEAFIMARFATFTVVSQAIVIPQKLKYEWSNVAEYNYIDTHVHNKLKNLRMFPSEVCSDEVFARRVFLDIVGLVPKADELAAFVADKDPKKREKLVDELLGRKEFVELWVMKFAELLKIRSDNQQVSYKAALLYFNWLQDQMSANVPMDQIVQKLIAADGGTFDNPATNYYQIERDTLKIAEDTAQVFMGMRIQCAQCHNHPFDRWTMDDYYGFASFFSQVSRKPGEDPREQIVFDRGNGEVKHHMPNRTPKPKFLGGDFAKIEQGQDRREVLAKWLASTENPFFAKNLANIVWAHFMGKGIIEPVDDVRVSNPPVNPQLLDALGSRFQEYKYDFKRLVRDICTSRTYQLSTHANETNANDERNFAKAPIRRIRAEVLLDVIGQVTETNEKFRGLPLGARAVQIADGNTTNFFLTTFGRAKRETVCSCEVEMDPSLSQALHLLNGQTTNGRILQGGVVRKMLLEKKMEPDQIVDELYVRCLSRKPSPEELQTLRANLPKDPKADIVETEKVLTDIFWALLNAPEFMFNH